MLRTAFSSLRIPASRAMYSTGPVAAAKEAASKVNRVAGDAALKGIETGEKAANAVKDAASTVTGQASKASGQAQGTASEMAGEAKGKAHELVGEAKGKANEVKGKL